MNESEMETWLNELLEYRETPEADNSVVKVRTYDEVGMLTKNCGLVVQMDDGSEFQITIVQSK